MDKYLRSTYYFDYNETSVQDMVKEFRNLPQREQISGLFLKVRDGWRYNPYVIYTKKDKYKASFLVDQHEGHCVDKSTLFIAGLRALEIPARLRLAKVVNHIATEKLTSLLGSNYIAPHGIVEVFSNDQWTKASTAFNQSLCEKYNVAPLYYDGTEDAMIQAYTQKDEKYMEYVEDYGHFDDLPFDFIFESFKTNYPQLIDKLKSDKLEI
ncbi:MAG: transglutaminase family protein [Cyclobacteriaceae bacterium]